MEDSSFYQLLLISGLAFFVPIVAARVPGQMLPAVVGEIIAGIVIGTSGLDLIESTAILEFLAQFGFAYLMFLSGLELDAAVLMAPGEAAYRGVRSFLASPLGSGLAMLVATLGIAFITPW